MTLKHNILYDKPVDTDAFSGAGHQRTATGLIAAIQEFDGTNRAIGLEGQWGAGKSSVIEIAEKELKGNGNRFRFFTFDLWRHQTSNFKRAFLEEFIHWAIAGPGAENAEKLKGILKEVRGKTNKIEREKHNNYSWFGVAAVLFVIFLPFLYMWLSPFSLLKYGNINFNIIAWLVLVFPTLIAIWALLEFKNRRREVSKETDPNKQETRAASASRVLGVFANKSETETISQSIRELDATDFEFSHVFHKILRLIQSNDCRLVLVFDNIDRLHHDNLKDIWSELRSIVARNESSIGDQETAAVETVTVIVPYDRPHVLRALDDQALNGSGERTRYIQEDFFRKSFDATLRVAPPVLSDVSAYFYQRLEEALQDQITTEAAQQTFQVFEERIRELGATPTPRHITSFINQIAGLWVQWQGEIPLPTIAVYATHRESIDPDPNVLAQPGTIQTTYQIIAQDPDYRKNLAGLAFNVEPQLADQILLDPQIERAFLSPPDGDDEPELLSNIRQSTGFAERLGTVFTNSASKWAEHSAQRLGHVANNLALLSAPEVTTNLAKQRVLEAFAFVPNVTPSQFDDCLPLLNLFRFCESEQQAVELTDQFSDWLSRSGNDRQDRSPADDGAALANFISKLAKQIHERWKKADIVDRCLKRISLPSDTEYLFYFASYAEDHDFKISKLASKTIKQQAPADLIAEKTVDEPGYAFDAIKQLTPRLGEAARLRIIQKLTTDLMSTSDAEAEDRALQIRMLALLEKSITTKGQRDKANAEIGKLLDDWALLSVVSDGQSSDKNVNIAIGHILHYYMQRDSDFALRADDVSNHGVYGNLTPAKTTLQNMIDTADVADETLDALTKDVIRSGQLSTMIAAAKQSTSHNALAKEVIANAVRNNQFNDPILSVVVPHYDFLKDILGDDVEVWLSRVGGMDPERWKNIILLNVVPLQLIEDITQRDEPGWKHVLSEVDRELNALTIDQWKPALRNENGVKGIAEARTAHGLKFKGSEFRTAFTDHLESIMKGDYADNGAGWDNLCLGLTPAIRKGIGADLLTRLRDAEAPSAAVLNTFISMYPSMFDALPFDNHAYTTLRRLIIPQVTVDLTEPVQEAYQRNKAVLRKAIVAADKDLVTELNDTLAALDSKDATPHSPDVTWWRKLLNVNTRTGRKK